ncbi:sorting nexin-4-like [Styela clava]
MTDNEKFDMFDEEGSEITNENKPGEIKKPESLLDALEINISDPERRTTTKGSLKMQETYIVYMIESKPRDLENIDPMLEEVTAVWRRYSEFELLRNYLIVSYPAIVMPPLPEKRTTFIWTKISTDTFDPEFLERRRVGLEVFLRRICGFPKRDEIVMAFLKQEEGWRETVMATGYQAKADSWLRTINASMRVKQPDSSFEELKDYATEMQSGIAAVLKARSKIADRIYGLFKIHANYSRIFKDWGAIEDPKMADALRKVSLELEKMSSSIDLLMEEEELYAEQLKEYHNFASSLKSIVKKHEALQYDVEYVESQLMSAHVEKKQVSSGVDKGFNFGGMRAKLFGGDTPEQKEIKLAKIDENIHMLEQSAETKRTAASTFSSEAKEEILQFKRRKQADLWEILTNYVILQIKMSKETKATWTRFKAAIQAA